MTDGPDIARLGALIGDPARALMLGALMRGQALSVGELAAVAGLGLPTASSHLAQLEAGGLIAARKQGRHKYLSLASDQVADLLEAMMGLAAAPQVGAGRTPRPGPRDPALREARSCYRHLAGVQGVALYDSLMARGYLALAEQGLMLTAPGREFATGFGVDLAALEGGRGPLCRECLDWSMRRSHLGGRLGRAFLSVILARHWAVEKPDSRALIFTPEGRRGFAQAFPMTAKARENSHAGVIRA